MTSAPFHSLNWRALVAATLTTLACGSALAQWQWVDGTGRKVFSDTAPSASIPEKNILKRPGTFAPSLPMAVSSTAATTASAAAATPGAPLVSGKDEQLELKKKQAEEAELAKKKEEQQKLAKARAENCERAKRAKATLDSGIRIATTNTKGEREIMDDKARAAEAQRLNGIFASDCGGSGVN